MKHKLRFLFVALLVVVLAIGAIAQTVVFSDDFNRGSVVTPLSSGGIPSMIYSSATTSTGTGSGSTTRTNLTIGSDYAGQILIGDSFSPSNQSNGVTYVSGPLSTYSSSFNTTLSSNSGDVTWAFHMRHNRSTFPLSGFNSGSYAGGVVLASTSGTLSSAGNGYAVVFEKATTATGAVTSGNTAVTLSAPNTGIYVGQTVTGTGISANTTVASISGTALTLSLAPTSSNAARALTFSLIATGSTTSGSPTITLTASNSNIVVGQAITGTGIAASTTVSAISGTTLTLSANATATGSGVALTIGGGTTIKLIKYSSGLTSGTRTPLITPTAEFFVDGNKTNWAAIKVIYTPSTNTWQMLLRNDGVGSSSPNSDFSNGFSTAGSVVDNTYTGSVMSHFGFIWNHSTSSSSGGYGSNTLFFDNYKVTTASTTAPTIAASNIAFSSFGGTSLNVAWNVGNGINHLVVVKAGSAVDANPVDATSYSANSAFISGSQLGTGNYVVYNGSGNAVSITGLSVGTTYYYKVFEFNGSGGAELYLTSATVSSSSSTILQSIASGTWSAGGTWASGFAPISSDKVTIANGHTVTVDATTSSCLDLTINNGGTLTANGDILASANKRQLRIYGTSVINNGTMGTGTDGLSLDIYNTGTTTLSGANTLNIATIRPGGITMNGILTIAGNVSLSYTTGLQFQNGTGQNFTTVNVNSGASLSTVGGADIKTASSVSTDITDFAPIFNINGTVTVDGSITLRSTFGAPSIVVNSPGAFTINSNVRLTTTTYTNPGVISGTGAFTLGPVGNLELATADGLNSSTGIVRTATRTFPTTASYSYVGTMAQMTGSLPSTIGRLTINNSNGITLSGNVTVDTTLTMTIGPVSLGGNTLAYGTGGTLSYNGTLAQTTSDIEFPTTNGPKNLTINNAAGVTLHAARTINGILTLTAGNLNNSTNQITIGPGGSIVTVAGTTSQTPLPVELTSFEAITKGRGIELTWKTASELNNAGFEVEKNVTGTWSKIGTVEGHGTTNAPQSYSYVDAVVKGKASYRLKIIDRDGKFEYSSIVEATVALTAEDFKLSQNFPNPFNPNTTITFAMKTAERVNVTVYNSLGQAVATLFNSFANPNELYSLTFDGKNLSSGIYFCKLRAGSIVENKKMLMLK